MKELLLLCMFLCPHHALAGQAPMVFGEGGQVKMLYDQRQRPQAVYLKDKVHIVYNGGGKPGGVARKTDTTPIAITYDPQTRTFSTPITLGEGSNDHHDGPVVWADMDERLHVFYGWHNVLGKHLICSEPDSIGTSRDDWSAAPAPAPMMSYPWTHRICDNRQLVVYRTGGHYSSWTYRISGDDGRTWDGPNNDVIDLDIKGGMDTDWSIYAAKAVSADGNFLHLAFIAYDDYKRPRSEEEKASGKLDPRREYNPRYKETIFLKYNLYYVRINLRTHELTNGQGEVLQTPIDLALANSKCMIWDTEWRGTGIVPSMVIDENNQAAFLHNISEPDSAHAFGYHYVRLVNGVWEHTRITDSTHKWNGGHLSRAADGTLHAYVITGKDHLDSEADMDRYGGGDVEEWKSTDQGCTWKRVRDLTPDRSQFPGWRFNNVQPVKRPDGSVVDGMLLFYGWNDPKAAQARAFLLHEDGNK